MCAVEVLSLLDTLTGDPAGARRRAEAELERAMQETGQLAAGVLMHAMAVAALAADDTRAAKSWAGELYAQQEQGAGYLAWHAQEVLMRAALADGDPHAARSHIETLVSVAHKLGNRRAIAIARTGMARASLLEGDFAKAELLARDALVVLSEHRWRIDAIAAIEIVAATTRRPEQAARLFGAAAGQRTALGIVRLPPENAVWDGYVAAADAALGRSKFAVAFDQGAQLSLDEAVAYARRGRRRHKRAPTGGRGLSPVEEQVARLAAGGRSNVQIAEELFISRSTVKSHLSHIYAKLGVANRIELARIASGWSG